MLSLRGASSNGSDDTWSTAPSTPLTGGHASTPQPSDSESDPDLGEESPITSSLPSSEHSTPSHRYPKRTPRSWTVERELDDIVDNFGRRIRLQWATKPFPIKFIKQRARGEEYVTVDGQDYTIAKRFDEFKDRYGNIVCRVKFPDSWVPEGNLDPPQLIDSSPVSSSGSDVPNLSSDPPSPQGPNLRPRLRGQLRRPTRAAWMKRVQLPKRPQHSTERASSALTWSDLDLAHIDDLREHATSDTADYGPAIHQKIQDAVKRGLYDTTTGILTAVLDRYQHDRPQRPVQFATWTVRHATHKFNFHGKENAGTFYAHWTGYDVRTPCTRCANQDREYGVFQGCVVASGFNQGACTNCSYSKGNRACSFRRDTSDPSGFRAAKRLPKASTYTVRSLAASNSPSDSDEGRASSPALRSRPRTRSVLTDTGLGLSDDDFIRDSNQRPRSQDDEEADGFVMSGGLNGLDGIGARGGDAESGCKHDEGKIYDPAPDYSDHDSGDDDEPEGGKDAHDSSGDAIEEERQSHHKRQREPVVIESSDESSDDSSDEDVDVYQRLRDLFRMKPSNDSSDNSTDGECESTPKRRRLTPAMDQGDTVNSSGRASRARSRTITSSLTAVPEASNTAQQVQDTRTLSNHHRRSTSTRPIISFAHTDMVFRGHKFARGEITQGQLDFLRMRSFDKDAIDWVGNEWRHAMHEREKELRTEALDFYKADGRRFLNKYLVPWVCPVSFGSL
ncbi:hypothetical protein KC340_g4175 [Hortaea werneckii]|nr:hypothetical protein KC342_g4226 [Hortaea werneckii]KAI7109660.1 hypothetical protein KC339_g588 [Hortaea werneckii]KAI7243441.1 hypothetical protein KC365_g2284 [Hortaea werneckii]KAI7330516.1 hypothetical protein KC340_g4175 [Hortaea werneckii]KAI7404663.1 hypothetical protein KC328_g1862 [Hortaea werneckii]